MPGSIARIAQLSLSFLVLGLGCSSPTPAAGAGDVEPDDFEALKADYDCGCGDGGKLDDLALLVGVNREDGLTRTFVPPLHEVPPEYRTRALQLRPLAVGSFMMMADAAYADLGRKLRVGSAYRTFCTQCSLFRAYVNEYGEASADTFSARAGHSEHQLATTIDMVDETGGFVGGPYNIPGAAGADPDLYAWLDKRAWEFGFTNSYPPNDADGGNRFASRTFEYTRYIPEPWHWRFVGRHAAALHHAMAEKSGIRLSTHELIDVVDEPTKEWSEILDESLAELDLAIDALESEHPDDALALARLTEPDRCDSATLNRRVESGACVQVDRIACGVQRCGWYLCDDGAWSCTALDACPAETYEHAQCPVDDVVVPTP